MSTYILNFDGACEPVNPGGIASYGYLITIDSKIISSGKGVVGEGNGMTNNVAEYSGLLAGLKAVAGLLKSGDKLQIRSDSQLLVRQLTGEYRVRSPRLRPLYDMAIEIIKTLQQDGVRIQIEWVPREENSEADALSHDAFVEYCREKHYIFRPCNCGGTLVPRIDPQTGHKFLRCSRYPRCKNTAPYPD